MTRTRGAGIRNPLLYPPELRGRKRERIKKVISNQESGLSVSVALTLDPTPISQLYRTAKTLYALKLESFNGILWWNGAEFQLHAFSGFFEENVALPSLII